MQGRVPLPDDAADGATATGTPVADGAGAGGGVGFSVGGEEDLSETTTRSRSKSGAGKGVGASSYDDLLSKMGSGGGERTSGTALVATDLKSDVDKLNRRMKNMNRCLIDPRSKFMQIWDFFTLGALFFTLIVTPYEVRARSLRPPRRHLSAPPPPPSAARTRPAAPSRRWRCCRPASTRSSSSTGSSTSSSSST